MDNFTNRSRRVFTLAKQEALRRGDHFLGTQHILLGLIKEGTGVAATALKDLGLHIAQVRSVLEGIIASGHAEDAPSEKFPQSPRYKQSLQRAQEEADKLTHNYIGTEHLLLGLMRDGESVACQVLYACGITPQQVIDHTMHLLGRSKEGVLFTSVRLLPETLEIVKKHRDKLGKATISGTLAHIIGCYDQLHS